MIHLSKIRICLWLLIFTGILFSRDIFTKLGSCLKYRLLELQEKQNGGLYKTTDPILDIWIQAENPANLINAGFHIRSYHGSFATADVPLSRIDKLARLSCVKSMRETSQCQLQLDQSMPEIGMNYVRSMASGTGYTGTGVIIGIIDTGIDWTHEDFIDDNGKTRILYIWDKTLDEYGGTRHIYSQSQIQQAIDQKDYSSVGGKDMYGHGTHVAGIAAGNGRATGNGLPACTYVGGAPDASLIIVKVSDDLFMNDTWIVDGLDFIFEKSDEEGLPCVVNLSMGRRSGSHDGRSLFELDVNNYLFNMPGRAIVVSAGNDGGKHIHVQHDFNPFIEDTLKVELQVNDNDPSQVDQISLEGWIHYLADVGITVVDPTGNKYGPVTAGEFYRSQENETAQIIVDNGSSGRNEYNGDKQICINITDGAQYNELFEGKWTFHFYNGSDRLDLWLVSHSLSAEIISSIDETTLLNEPAHAPLVVAVGSYISRIQWPNMTGSSWKPEGLTLGALSSTSSPGPSRINSLYNHTQHKPDITAPGEHVVSAQSNFSEYWPDDYEMASDGVHRAWSGTSFATPHVTGLIACIFEENPMLTANAVKGRLLNTKKDAFTGDEIWNNEWGYGKIDAPAAMGISHVEKEKETALPDHPYLISNFPNPFNGCTMITVYPNLTRVHSNFKYLEILNIRGQLIRYYTLPESREKIIKIQWDGRDENFQALPSGVYFVRLGESDKHIPMKNDIKYMSKKMILMR